ncbi:MAG: hypothetical protein M0R03_23530 [Novosphingobium sp.]|nr:hypothetical protein [Novosphingobium sp.]
MGRKILWIGVIIVAIALFIFLILRQEKKDQRSFNKYEFPETIQVENFTNYQKADTIIMILANKIMKWDSIRVLVYYMHDGTNQNGEIELYGIVQRIPFYPYNYLILLNKNLSFYKLKETLCHEFIHIDQYRDPIYNLQIFGDIAVYKGDTIKLREVPYDQRPFEQMAFRNQERILKELDKFLYE